MRRMTPSWRSSSRRCGVSSTRPGKRRAAGERLDASVRPRRGRCRTRKRRARIWPRGSASTQGDLRCHEPFFHTFGIEAAPAPERSGSRKIQLPAPSAPAARDPRGVEPARRRARSAPAERGTALGWALENLGGRPLPREISQVRPLRGQPLPSEIPGAPSEGSRCPPRFPGALSGGSRCPPRFPGALSGGSRCPPEISLRDRLRDAAAVALRHRERKSRGAAAALRDFQSAQRWAGRSERWAEACGERAESEKERAETKIGSGGRGSIDEGCHREREGRHYPATSSAPTFWNPRGSLFPRSARLPANSFQSEGFMLR